MLYLSDLIGKRITAAGNTTVGRVSDLVAHLEVPDDSKEKEHPALRLKGITTRAGVGRPPFFVPAPQIDSFDATGVRLHPSRSDLLPYERGDADLLLTRDLWDKQIIDLQSRRVARVNDIILDRRSDEQEDVWYISGVDVALGALLRRLKLARPLEALIQRPIGAQVIEWPDVDLFASNIPGNPLVEHKKLATLHPVEIARITDAVSYHQGAELICSLNETLAADTLEEIAADRQTDLVDQMPEDRAAGIIGEMSPDDATDLIAELPEKKASALLKAMDEARADDVRRLMRYPDHTAGREMTTDFVCVRPTMTVEDVIEANKPRFLSADLIYYMYVTASDDDDSLVGIITVRDLLVQSRDTPVSDFMLTDFLAVRPGEHEREVARKMAEYNLLALPVVDRNNTLLGVITIDDALDSLLPAGWKKRLPRIFS